MLEEFIVRVRMIPKMLETLDISKRVLWLEATSRRRWQAKLRHGSKSKKQAAYRQGRYSLKQNEG